MNKIDVCKKTRALAAQTLVNALNSVLKPNEPVSEKSICETWLLELRKNQTIFSEGWYTPPPHGLCALFGTADKKSRQNYKYLRQKEQWPQSDIFLGDKNEMGYLFASPIDKESGIIGDFGLTIYTGNDPKIKEHLQNCMNINLEILKFIEVGKKFSEVFKFAEQLIAEKGFTNGVVSTTDPAGRDIGHTVPGTFIEWNYDEKVILKKGGGDWETTKNMISEKRIFVSPIEETIYQPGMVITLEPRLTIEDKSEIPMGSFHTMVVINQDGTKEFLTNFDEIFKIFGMSYML